MRDFRSLIGRQRRSPSRTAFRASFPLWRRFVFLNLTRRDLADHDGGADHVGGALFAFRASGRGRPPQVQESR